MNEVSIQVGDTVQGIASGRVGTVTGWYMKDQVARVAWKTGALQNVGTKNLTVIARGPAPSAPSLRVKRTASRLTLS